MKTDLMTIRSSTSNALFKRLLFKGSLLSLLGFIPLMYGALWMNVEELSIWGLPIFITSTACIIYGMLPFKKFAALQKHPHALHLAHTQSVSYDHAGRKTLTIPSGAIEAMSYVERAAFYGIRVHLRKSAKGKIAIHNPKFDYKKFEKISRKKFGCDLFFPYFSKRSFEKIEFKSPLE